MTESRCPFRMKGFDQPDTCDEKCAWLMRVIDYDQRNSRACAMSVIAMRDEMNEWVPANITDVNANDGLAVENGVSEASMDANDGSELQDSREKLEVDVITTFGDGLVRSIIMRLLDRQAAITERDLCRQCSWPSLAAMPDKEAYDRIAELQAKLNQMTVERDILQDCVDDLNADTSELQAKVDELTSELTAARNAHAQAEHEAVILREKLGRMLDCSHEITRIGGDC